MTRSILQLSAPLKNIAAISATSEMSAIWAQLAPEVRPKVPTMVRDRKAPIMKTSPWAKLINSTMP
jgi:hypothetical protein